MPKIELIKWEDHSGGIMRWTDIDEMKSTNDNPYTVETVGYVIAENRHRLTLIQNYACNDMGNHAMTIIKKNIINRRVLKK